MTKHLRTSTAALAVLAFAAIGCETDADTTVEEPAFDDTTVEEPVEEPTDGTTDGTEAEEDPAMDEVETEDDPA